MCKSWQYPPSSYRLRIEKVLGRTQHLSVGTRPSQTSHDENPAVGNLGRSHSHQLIFWRTIQVFLDKGFERGFIFTVGSLAVATTSLSFDANLLVEQGSPRMLSTRHTALNECLSWGEPYSVLLGREWRRLVAICLNLIIGSFCLTIQLGMKSCNELAVAPSLLKAYQKFQVNWVNGLWP